MEETERPNSRNPPWQGEAESNAVSFGTWLRRQRELREITLREIADVTKISSRYLEALEQDRFDILPAPVFAKGFLREYAKFVGLDPDDVVNTYLIALQGEPDPNAPPEQPRRPRREFDWSSALLLIGGVAILVAIVAIAAFYVERKRSRAQTELPPIAAPPPAVAVETVIETPAEPPPAVPLLVTMDFTEDCWVEAVVDEDQRISELHVQGESLQILANEKVFFATLGNSEAVRIEVNGEPYDFAPGTGRRVIHDIEINLETVQSLVEAEN